MDYEREYKRLQSQIDDERWQESRRRDEEYQERQEALARRHREDIEAQSYAENWNEAFNKGIARYRREAAEEKAFEQQAPEERHDQFFQKLLAEAEFGRTAYNDEMN